ncbi:hypothetical protein GCM10027341_46940 [Spirosoma knui]
MRYWLLFVFLVSSLASCVDILDLRLRGTVDVIVVDGTITNLAEPQVIRLNRSKADPLTGRFGSLPITKATVEVVIDSSQRIAAHETVNGTYQFPSDFRGQIGHAYQLRFTLSDGSRYVSTQQIMQPVPPVTHVLAQFNPASFVKPFADGAYRAGHDMYLTTQDPIDQHNYYRWDWRLFERQEWCQSCYEGIYAVNEILYPISSFAYKSGTNPFEDCFFPPSSSEAYQQVKNVRFDYECRTQCWEIIQNYSLNLFDDALANGGLISQRLVAQIPFYQYRPALVALRQTSLTADAYRYFSLFQQQTQNTGGLADTPPTALVGNVRNEANAQENVIGYFAASAVAEVRYWLDRKDTYGSAPGLFLALNGRNPVSEPPPPFGPSFIIDGPPRPPTAVCRLSDTRTPFKPEGWRE